MSTATHFPVFSSDADLLRPVARAYPDGHAVPDHWHEGGQLIYALSGVMELGCEHGFWVISPQQALWMPPRLPHRLRARSPVTLRTVYLAPDVCPASLPAHPQSLVVPPLLRELILRATPVRSDTAASSRDAHLMTLLLDEIEWAQAVPLRLTMPQDGRLQKVCLGLLKTPGDNSTLEQWGQRVGASARTLTRLFQAELGTSFLLWRQQARVFSAIPRLNQGESVTRIAIDLGYRSQGAFSTAFRRLMGHAPRDFR
jgi:AraC-like DNA-binding protein